MDKRNAAKFIALEIGLAGPAEDYSLMEAVYWAKVRIAANARESALLEALVQQINATDERMP